MKPITQLAKYAVALEKDLTLACTSNNPCLVCGHYKPNLKEKCELLGWHCEWVWRGEQSNEQN